MKQVDAGSLDANDPLAAIRDTFLLPPDCIYLCGNSLGPLTRNSADRVSRVVGEEWGNGLVSSWNEAHWIDLAEHCAARLAPLVGAEPGQLICCDSISINLFKLLWHAVRQQAGRTTILATEDSFPTDIYVADGVCKALGPDTCRVHLVDEKDIEKSINNHTAVLLLSHVNFRTGRRLDMEKLTSLAHSHGALAIWDLAHSAGVLPIELDAWHIDYAVACGYKYLNGGPGAPAFIYVNHRHTEHLQNPIQGWMGHAAPFSFDSSYTMATGATGLLTGTPPILSMASLDAALEIFQELDMDLLNQKVADLSDLFIELKESCPALDCLELISPTPAAQRGAQLSFRHDQAYALCRALADAGVVADFRAPDLLRLGFSPLILRFQDIVQAAERLESTVESRAYEAEEYQTKKKVT